MGGVNKDERNKPCTGCRRWLPLTAEYYVPMGRTAAGTQRWSSMCRTCKGAQDNARNRYAHANESEAARKMRLARMSARQKAARRVAAVHPELFDMFYREEMKRMGYDPELDLRLYQHERRKRA